jgi:hypothetical protein
VPNFLFGLVAGAHFSAVVTIVAVRDARVQKGLGLFPTELSLPPPPDKCALPSRAAQAAGPPAGSVEMLFDSRRRLGPATRNVMPAEP